MFDVSDVLDKAKESLNLDDMDLSTLLNSDFVKKYTKFENIQALLGNFDLPTNLDDLKDIPGEKLDEIIAKASDFSSWKEMLAKASSEFLGK